MYLKPDGTIDRSATRAGWLAPGVPGTVRGLALAHRRFGKLPWADVVRGTVVPSMRWTPAMVTTVVAVLGTTISPYLFFWQASEEVEEQQLEPGEAPLKYAPEQADRLGRVELDTWFGMAQAA